MLISKIQVSKESIIKDSKFTTNLEIHISPEDEVENVLFLANSLLSDDSSYDKWTLEAYKKSLADLGDEIDPSFKATLEDYIKKCEFYESFKEEVSKSKEINRDFEKLRHDIRMKMSNLCLNTEIVEGSKDSPDLNGLSGHGFPGLE